MAIEAKEASTTETKVEEATLVESTPEEGKTEETTKEASKGSTATLFPDYLDSAPAEEKDGQGVAPKEEESAPQTEDEPVQAIDMESFSDSLVKTNVSGVETDVKVKDLVKAYQTDSYLTQKGQRLADKERELNERTQTLNVKPQESKPEQEELSEESKWVRSEIQPELDKRDKQIEDLQKKLAGLAESTKDAAYDSMLTRADSAVKSKKVRGDGSPVFDDFKSYVPKIEQFIASLPAKDQAVMLNDMGYISIYNDMKMTDLVTSGPAPKKEAKVNAEKRPKPALKKIPVVESGTGTSAGAADENASYTKAFDRATKSGRTEDWQSLFQEQYGD